MGFVGQQIAAANHLLRFGLETRERSIVLKGEAIIDFWTKHSLTDVGLPKTWFDVNPNRWRDYETYLRIACDGAVGVLSGLETVRRHGRDKPEWRKYCERFAGTGLLQLRMLTAHFTDSTLSLDNQFRTTFNTTHPIRFLVDIAAVTKSDKYLRAAVVGWGVIAVGTSIRISSTWAARPTTLTWLTRRRVL